MTGRAMDLEDKSIPFEVYVAKFAEGGIVEERITGQEVESPSVQLRVLPAARPSCSRPTTSCSAGRAGRCTSGGFPAAAEYARLITGHAERIGQRLAQEGALGRFAVDFVVVRDGGGRGRPTPSSSTCGGGTTHPFLTLQFLADGRYDPSTALFTTPEAARSTSVATDHLESPSLRGLAPADLFDIVARHGLHFDQSRQEGIVLHDQLPDRARAGRHDRRRRHPRRGEPPLLRGRADPARRGTVSWRSELTCADRCRPRSGEAVTPPCSSRPTSRTATSHPCSASLHTTAAGHRVRFLAGDRFADAVRGTGSEFIRWPDGAQVDHRAAIAEARADGDRREGPRVVRNIEQVFIAPARDQFEALVAAIDASPPMPCRTSSRPRRRRSRAVARAEAPARCLWHPPAQAVQRRHVSVGLGILPRDDLIGHTRNRVLNFMAKHVILRTRSAR